MKRLEYQLSSVLHGNAANADYVNDLGDWGLVIAKKPVGIGTTFHYTVSRHLPNSRQASSEREYRSKDGFISMPMGCIRMRLGRPSTG